VLGGGGLAGAEGGGVEEDEKSAEAAERVWRPFHGLHRAGKVGWRQWNANHEKSNEHHGVSAD
jgi:hypothetical protein